MNNEYYTLEDVSNILSFLKKIVKGWEKNNILVPTIGQKKEN